MMARTNIMGFGLPFPLTLPILHQTLLIVQAFFSVFFIFFCWLTAHVLQIANAST
jgi:hypothetical protein